MSTLWTVIIIVILLAIIFWLVLSQNKEDESGENKIESNKPIEGVEYKEEQEDKEEK